MSLDDTLREILKAASISGRYGDTHEATYQELTARIKAAFADEGYVTPENAKKVQEMLHQMANLANDAFHLPTIQYIKPNKAITKAQNLMTGQEWYERYKNASAGLYTNMAQGFLDLEIPPEVFTAFDEAAKRAAGIQ